MWRSASAGIVLVVFDEAADARRPGVGALHHPARWQEDEAALGLRQIAGPLPEAPGRQPALGLLVDRVPRRQVVGHPAPRRTRLHDVAQPVEHRAQTVLALS